MDRLAIAIRRIEMRGDGLMPRNPTRYSPRPKYHAYIEQDFYSRNAIRITYINELIAKFRAAGMEITQQSIFYALVSKKEIANSQAEAKALSNLITNARLAGHIDPYAIDDPTRSFYTVDAWGSPVDVLTEGARDYQRRMYLSSGSAVLPDQAGLYQLTIAGGWPDEGKVRFSVGLTIGTPPSNWPPPAPTATVPGVVGLTTPQAMKVLMAAGFDSVSVAAPSGATKVQIAIGAVVTAQDPAAGTKTQVTTTINLTVSTTG